MTECQKYNAYFVYVNTATNNCKTKIYAKHKEL